MIQAFTFYVFYSFVLVFSALPFRVQYMAGDILALLLQYVARYRRKVVRENLHNSFPEKTVSELRTIERKFYHYLADSFVETFSQVNLSVEEHKKRMVYKNIDLLDKYNAQGKAVLIAMGHYANWEICSSMALHTKMTILAIYKKINNPYFDRFYQQLRSSRGVVPVPMEEILRKILEYHSRKIPTGTMFLVDQRPLRKNIRYWCSFLNQETPIYLGIEKIAHKINAAVVFLKITPTKRGYYEAEFIPICDDPAESPEFEITEKHVRILEEIIRERPEYWLWSHRRWRHKKIEQE